MRVLNGATWILALGLMAAMLSTQSWAQPQPPQVAKPASAPSVPATTPPGPIAATQAPTPRPSLLADIIEDYNYDPTGKRDPFLPFTAPRPVQLGSRQGPLLPLQRFDIDQLKVIGIIWDVRSPKAMIIDPTGAGHVVIPKSRVGRNNGYIEEIREGEIIIVEPLSKDGQITYLTRVLKIQKKE